MAIGDPQGDPTLASDADREIICARLQEAHVHGRERILEVVQIIEKRVSAPLAAEALVDHSPPPPEKEWYETFARDPGAGRPTKKDRRNLDRLRNRQ